MKPYLTHADTKQIYTLVDECCEMWDDAAAWQRHVATTMEALVGGFTGVIFLSERQNGIPVIVEATRATPGSSPPSAMLEAFIALGGEVKIPGFDQAFPKALQNSVSVGCLREYSDRRSFEASPFFDIVIRSLGAHDRMGALAVIDSKTHLSLSVARAPRERRFANREKSVIGLLAIALGPKIAARLATRHQKGRHDLTPRENQVLSALLSGDSEKQVAGRLSISAATVHEHVMSLYRYFGASSRGELMAYFVKRVPVPKKATGSPRAL